MDWRPCMEKYFRGHLRAVSLTSLRALTAIASCLDKLFDSRAMGLALGRNPEVVTQGYDKELGVATSLDLKSKGLPEPHIRSQNLICRRGNWEWHVKTTFIGTMIREDSTEGFIAAQKKRQLRREQLTQFIKSIDFSSLHLVDDNVTALTAASNTSLCPTWSLVPYNISNLPADNGYRAFCGQLYCGIREDPGKIIYPPLPELFKKSKVLPLSCIKIERVLDAAVSVVHTKQEDRFCVFKSIDRPLYQPRDTEVVLTEWAHLSRMSPCLSIARLVATITSGNPYHTGKQGDRNIVFIKSTISP